MLARLVATADYRRLLACSELVGDPQKLFTMSTLEMIKYLEERGCKVVGLEVNETRLDAKFECPPCFKALLVHCDDVGCHIIEKDVLFAASKGVRVP